MRIKPFRGYRYVAGGRDISDIVAPPYDQITPALQERLYAAHPGNVVRVTFPRDEPDRHRQARAVLDRWLAEGLWAPEARPAIYPYHQTYTVDGQRVTRMGFIAAGEVTEYAAGTVRPHERTHAGPKKERLEHLEATGADTGLIFMLVSDSGGDLLRATAPEGEPIAEARDLRGESHRLWRLTDAAVLARVAWLMAPRPVIIADGHHRYETAVEYARRRSAASEKLMAFFTLEAPGLTIFPTHRLVHGLPTFSFARLVEEARRWFDVAPLPDPLAFRPTSRTLGVVSGAESAVLTFREDPAAGVPWPGGTSAAWRSLAVSILHEALLRPVLGITDAMLEAKTHVDYTPDQADAVTATRAGRAQAAFLIAPTTPEELQTVVRGGEVLPQKSTFFYPKLLDGLVFHLPERR